MGHWEKADKIEAVKNPTKEPPPMPYDHLITGLPFIKVEEVTYGYPIRVQYRVDCAAVCPRCGGQELRLKDKKSRKIKGITHADVPTELYLAV
ncbi:MAG TPA: hypothetical protein DD400_00525, partial [Rhodospirillaceae bacterium]|nr:hypothetical protein [Rhodospirillaceae bacterium]